MSNRNERRRQQAAFRSAVQRERQARNSGEWGAWQDRSIEMREGAKSGPGWFRELDRAFSNKAFAVLIRTVETSWGPVDHAAIRTTSNDRPMWSELQRIKDELFGRERTAVEVYPPANEVVDQADMFHLWILPAGMELPFTICPQRIQDVGEAA